LLPPVCWRLLLLRPATTAPPVISLVLQTKQLISNSAHDTAAKELENCLLNATTNYLDNLRSSTR
jgi:hypothetical protein